MLLCGLNAGPGILFEPSWIHSRLFFLLHSSAFPWLPQNIISFSFFFNDALSLESILLLTFNSFGFFSPVTFAFMFLFLSFTLWLQFILLFFQDASYLLSPLCNIIQFRRNGRTSVPAQLKCWYRLLALLNMSDYLIRKIAFKKPIDFPVLFFNL